VQWVVSGYALTFGLTLVAGGRLGDAYGRRRMMLIGLVGFIVASAAVGLAPNEQLVIAARLAQGAAAGLLTPQNSGLIQQLFRGAERGRAFGLFGLTVSVSAATGPVLGGLILAVLGAEHGWRAIFLVNVPIGLVAMAFVARRVPGRHGSTEPARLDLVGALLLGAGVLCLLLPMVSAMSGLHPVQLLLLGTVPALWGFVHWERRLVARGGMPLLDVPLLSHAPGYASGIAIGTAYFTGFTGAILVLSVYLQDGLGSSPLAAGLLLSPFAVGAALTATPAGRAVSVVGRRLTVAALVVVVLGLVAVALLVPVARHGHLWAALGVPLLVAGLGGGAVVSPNFTLTLADVPPRMGGAAGGALQTGQRIGSALGAALMISTYEITLGRTSSPGTALRVSVLAGVVVIVAATALAIRDLRFDADRDLA
jgi:MFS family permease